MIRRKILAGKSWPPIFFRLNQENNEELKALNITVRHESIWKMFRVVKPTAIWRTVADKITIWVLLECSTNLLMHQGKQASDCYCTKIMTANKANSRSTIVKPRYGTLSVQTDWILSVKCDSSITYHLIAYLSTIFCWPCVSKLLSMRYLSQASLVLYNPIGIQLWNPGRPILFTLNSCPI